MTQLAKIVTLALIFLILGVPAQPNSQAAAQNAQTTEPFHIFMVVWRGRTPVEDGFEAYLRERGIPYRITFRNLERDRGRIPGFVDEINELKPDLVYTWGTSTSTGILGKFGDRDTDTHAQDIPGIFTLVAYPVAAGLVASDEQPGGSVTGVRFLAPVEAQLNAIRAYRPFERLAVIYNPNERNSTLNVEELRRYAQSEGFTLIEKPAPMDEGGKPIGAEVPALVLSAKSDGAEFLYIGPDSFTAVNADALTSTAILVGLPTFAATEFPLLNSQAMSGLVSRYYSLGKLTGRQAERILVDGVAPEDLPVASLSRYSLILNMPVVRALEIYPPMSMLQIADIIR